MNGRKACSVVLLLAWSALLLAGCGPASRLRLQTGRTISRAREIPANEIDEYALQATAGQILGANIVSPEGDVYLAIHCGNGGGTLVHPTSKATRWTGVMPAAEECGIQAIGGRADTDYLMVVALMPRTEGAQDPHLRFVGMYHVKAPTANALHDLTLFLNADGSAALTGTAGVRKLTPFVMQGTWRSEGDAAMVELTEQGGETFAYPEAFTIEWRDGRFTVQRGDANSWRTAGLQFVPAQGDYHAMVRGLHKRLEAVGYVEYKDPGTAGDFYTEVTRRAVVAFQNSQGLLPHGVAGAATWAALDIALLPQRTASGEPIVYLTFDDGPDNRYTPQILDLLALYNAQATFFILGEQALYFPDLIRDEVAAGHYVANHGFAHHTFENMSRNELFREIQKTENLLREAAGDLFAWGGDVHFLRPPYGTTGDNTQEYAAESGYVMVMWDVDSQDWQRPGAAQVVANVLNHVGPGDIVLMHDGGGDRSQTILALEVILRELSARGYRFRSIFGD